MVMGMNEPMNKADKAVIRHYIMYSFIDSWYLHTIYVLRQDIVQLYFIHACRIQGLLVWVLSTANLLNATWSLVSCKASLGDGHIPLQPCSKSYGQQMASYGHLKATKKTRAVWFGYLDGGFRYFWCSSRSLGEWSNLISIFFKWVGSTTNYRYVCSFSALGIGCRSPIWWQIFAVQKTYQDSRIQQFLTSGSECFLESVGDLTNMTTLVGDTLPETNMALQNEPSQKETCLPTIHFQVLC